LRNEEYRGWSLLSEERKRGSGKVGSGKIKEGHVNHYKEFKFDVSVIRIREVFYLGNDTFLFSYGERKKKD
jgi:hypothetical protein